MKLLFALALAGAVLFGLAGITMIFASFWAGEWGTGLAFFFSGMFAALLAIGSAVCAGWISSDYLD